MDNDGSIIFMAAYVLSIYGITYDAKYFCNIERKKHTMGKHLKGDWAVVVCVCSSVLLYGLKNKS